MHELSIASTLLDMVESEARKAGLTQVAEVRVRVGPLSGVNADALDFCFGAIVEKSWCKGAKLRIEVPPGTLHCRGCGRTAEVTELVFLCPHCGEADIRLDASRELELREIRGE